MSHSICVLVTLTVFYLVLIDLVPPTSLTVPLIGQYLLFTMCLVAFSVVISVVTVNWYRRDGTLRKLARKKCDERAFMRKALLFFQIQCRLGFISSLYIRYRKSSLWIRPMKTTPDPIRTRVSPVSKLVFNLFVLNCCICACTRLFVRFRLANTCKYYSTRQSIFQLNATC